MFGKKTNTIKNKGTKINFVTESKEQRWILRRWAEKWSSLIEQSTVTSFEPDISADVNIFLNYALYKPCSTKTVAFFTHREKNTDKKQIFDNVAQDCDYCIAQSKNTLKLLPKSKSCIIRPGVGDIFYKKKSLIIGISGREYGSGRKRFEYIDTLKKIEGIDIVWTGGKIKYRDLPDFYDKIDYLLVLSDNEGGPVPVLEALARHKPVIAPNVGWCWEYPVIKYNSLGELKTILRDLNLNQKQWVVSAKDIVKLSTRLKNEKI